MENNHNQDYIDLRRGFSQEIEPLEEPPSPEEPPKKRIKFAFAPKHSNFFMLILVLTAIFLQIMLAVVVGTLMVVDPTFQLTDIPTWAMGLGSQILMLGIPCLIYLLVKRKHIRDILPMRPLGFLNSAMIIGMSLMMIPALMMINIVSQLVFPNVIGEAMTGVMQEGGIWLSLVIFALVPPVFEEVAFRGIGFVGFRHVKIGVAAFLNGLLFGAFHMNMNQFFYAFAGGVIFCYLMYYTKSIWAPILSHFIVNATGALLTYALGNIDPEMMAMAAEIDLMQGGQEVLRLFAGLGIFAVVTMGIFIGIYIAFKRHNLRRNKAEGIITDTAAAARAQGLYHVRTFTWSFWVAIFLLALMMLLIHLGPMLMNMMLYPYQITGAVCG